MIKYYIFAIIATFLSMLLRDKSKEIASLLIVCASLIIGNFILEKMIEVISFFKYISETFLIAKDYIVILIKMLGIAYITELSSAILKELKEDNLSHLIEIIARLSMVIISFPIIKSLIKLIGDL